MKKLFNLKKKIGRRNVTLSIVALILILLTFVSVSYSWIEEVSNVEITTNNDSQQSPLHISNSSIMSDIEMENQSTPNTAVNLKDYFYEGGNMHLSGCYSDGENFKFPVSGSTSTSATYRDGTKDDANTNYLSATFKLTSKDQPTAYWFERTDANASSTGSNNYIKTKNYTNETDPDTRERIPSSTSTYNSTIEEKLRVSITIGGATTVYAFNNDGSYKTAPNTTAATADRKAVRDFVHYPETYDNSNPVGNWKTSNNKTNKYNQGAGENLNGNILFTVGKNKTETVTVKMWLEQNDVVQDVDLSDIKLRITSGWAKTRRIYVRDKTVKEPSPHDTTNWLPNGIAKMYWGLKNDNGTWTNLGQLKRINSTTVYYIDLPSVYNGRETALFRCASDFTTSGSNLWDMWETSFPDTFHSETFSVYSTSYGTWSTVDATAVYFVDSGFMEGKATNSPSVYLWDSTKIIDSTLNGKVVKNADWPGAKMTKMGDTTGSSNQDLGLWAFFYASDYDRAVFNDTISKSGDSGNAEFQSQNIHYSWTNNGSTQNWSGKYFDIATLDWYASPTKLPKYTDHYIECDFPGGNNMGKVRFSYKGSSTKSATGATFMNGTTANTNEVARMYVKWGNRDGYNYQFKIHAGNKTYGMNDAVLYAGGNETYRLYDNNTNYAKIHLTGNNSIHSIYLKGFGRTADNTADYVDVYLSDDITYPATD
jgi:hypothetical protein